jgi:nicotinamidase-related amidase
MAEIKLFVRPENTALIIHDMENGFWKPPYTNSNKAESIIGPIQNMLAVARRLEMPIIYTLVVYGPQRFEVSLRRKIVGMQGVERCDEGTPGAEVIDELKPRADDIVIKKIRYSGFYETGLEQRLRRLGVQNLLITGGSTNWGVEALARDAEYRDFVPIVLSDCTLGTSPELHAATLANVDLFIGFVKSSDEAIRMLTSA